MRGILSYDALFYLYLTGFNLDLCVIRSITSFIEYSVWNVMFIAFNLLTITQSHTKKNNWIITNIIGPFTESSPDYKSWLSKKTEFLRSDRTLPLFELTGKGCQIFKKKKSINPRSAFLEDDMKDFLLLIFYFLIFSVSYEIYNILKKGEQIVVFT